MNTEEFVQNTVSRTLSKYDERFSTVAESGSYDDLSDKPTIPEAYDDTALAARVTAVEDGKASLQVAAIPGGGGGEEINALVSQGETQMSVNYYKDGELPKTLNLNVDSDHFTIPTTGYVDTELAKKGNAKITFDNEYQYLQIRDDNGTDIGFSQETANTVRVQEYAKDGRGQVHPIFDETLTSKTYVDGALANKQDTLVSGTNIKTFNGESLLGSGDIPIPAYVGSGWGVAKTGSVLLSNTSTTPNVIDISDLGLSSVDDYQVAISFDDIPSANNSVVVTKISNDSFSVAGPQARITVYYTVFAKGYGGVPNGGTAGQVLTKKSGADGDTEWREGGGGINFEVGAEKWYGTYKEDGVTYQVYSKIIKIDALPSVAGITTYDHGISGIKQILQVYGFCTNGFVMNAPRQNLQDNISIYQASKSASNQTFSIEVGKDRSSLGAYVCLVYAKNN